MPVCRQKTLLLGAAAQAGVFFALIGSLLLGLSPFFDFGLLEASSIGIIGGADGPTTIYIATRMREIGQSIPGLQVKDIVGATAVAAYSYMALVPIIQPPIMRWLTTQKERKIRMKQLKPISQNVKIIFPLATTVIIVLLLPGVAPLLGMLMLGNLFQKTAKPATS